jgi:hypothetical protein
MSEAVKDVTAEDRKVIDILNPEATLPNSIKGFYTDAQRAAIKQALKDGHVTTTLKKVKISADKSGTNKDEFWPYVSYSAVDEEGMQALAGGRMNARVKVDKDAESYKALSKEDKELADADDQDGSADYFNYGYGLTIMQPIRLYMADNVGGASKAVDKQVDQIMKLGLFPDKDKARAFVINQRRELGQDVPE